MKKTFILKKITIALSVLVFVMSVNHAYARTELTSDITLNVSTTGSDSNDCVTAPCATIQRAVDVLKQGYDFTCHKVTVNVAKGSYSGFWVAGSFLGQCKHTDFEVVGNPSTQIPINSDWTINSSVIFTDGARGYIRGFNIQTTAGPGLSADDGGTKLYGGYMNFGKVATAQITAGPYARAKMVNNYSISGGAIQHINASVGQVQIMPGVIAIITGMPTFTQFALAIEGGLVNISYGSTKFWNALGYNCSDKTICAIGARYGSVLRSVIYTGGGGDYYLPGNTSGTVSADSIYN